MLDYHRDEHRVHLIVYHLIWCPRRRKPVVVGEGARQCEELIRQTCQERGWEILALSMQPDHLHLFVRAWPGNSAAAEGVKTCKGLTASTVRKACPHLRTLPSMWTRSFCASTAGNVSHDTIQQDIVAQKGV